MGKIADRIRARYAAAGGQKEKDVASKEDLRRLKRDLDERLPRQQPSTIQTMSKAARMMGRGFGNIGRSLNNPYDTRRPKISQLPIRRRDMGISITPNLDKLKHPKFRNRDIRGRRIK